MDRRAFLRSSTAVAVTAAVGPTILGATDKAGTKTPTVGAGAHVYECHHGWGTLPDAFDWQTTHNVAVDAAGLVYITHQGIGKKEDTVVVFDGAGKFVRSFGDKWHGGGHGLDIRKEGAEEFIYLTNTNASPKVVKTNLKGEVVWAKERPETPEYADPKARFSPTNVAFLPDGGFVVADGYGSNFLQWYDAAGKFVKQTGGKGKGEGQFQTPHGLWLDTRSNGPEKAEPRLFVCDRANARLQTFDLKGEYIAQTKKDMVLFPANIDTRGDVMLVPDLHARVSLFDTKGTTVHLGDDEAWRKKVLANGNKLRTQPKEWVDGKFVHPHDACFDAAGNIFVVEWVVGGRVTYLKKVA